MFGGAVDGLRYWSSWWPEYTDARIIAYNNSKYLVQLSAQKLIKLVNGEPVDQWHQNRIDAGLDQLGAVLDITM